MRMARLCGFCRTWCQFVGLLVAAAGAPAQDNARSVRAIIERAEQARGGPEAAKVLGTVYMKRQGHLINPKDTNLTADVDEESWCDGNREATTMIISSAGKKHVLRSLIDGHGGWKYVDGLSVPLSEGDQKDGRRRLRLSEVMAITPLLRDRSYQLGELKQVHIGETLTNRVRVRYKDELDVTLAFDAKTGLLTELIHTFVDANGKTWRCRDVVSDYKDIKGFKYSSRIVRYVDDQKASEFVTTELRPVAGHPASVFQRPSKLP